MPISWNEIRHNAIQFSREWCGATSESSDKQTFWNEFFAVFGIPRKTVAAFEVPVLKTSGNFGKIDLLWKNMLLVEHKSHGEDLDKAKTQAFDYIQAMLAEARAPQHCTLADLYDPVAMPPRLHQAHEHLDRAVDLCYRKEPFASDRHRVEHLFSLYEQLTAPLLPVTKKRKRA